MRLNEIDGTPVKDAKNAVTLVITDSDIRKASTKRPDACAAAKACTRQFKTDAHVHLSVVYLKSPNGKSWTRYRTPPRLRQEIIAFDKGGRFAPGEYTLSAPQPAHRLGERTNTPVRTGKGKSTQRRAYHVVTDVRPHA